MSGSPNEFSDLDRTVMSPNGTAHDLVHDVASGGAGWGLLWGKIKTTRDPVVNVYAKGRLVHQEPAACRQDAQRIVARLEELIRAGTFGAP